jgi:hypothetical protein
MLPKECVIGQDGGWEFAMATSAIKKLRAAQAPMSLRVIASPARAIAASHELKRSSP